jgi:1-acylglycerone phosphate reductase
MRVEFKPLGIRVVTVGTGGLDSGANELHDLEIPEGSLYAGAELAVPSQKKGIRTEEFARGVVDDLLRASGPPPVVWSGAMAWLAWILTWLGWVGMLHQSQIKQSGLGNVKPPRRFNEAGGKQGVD